MGNRRKRGGLAIQAAMIVYVSVHTKAKSNHPKSIPDLCKKIHKTKRDDGSGQVLTK
jgi:hypothetical protein